jgi:hypothetical protein
MPTLSKWLERIGPLAGLGNAGAVTNAGRACDERRQLEAATDATLDRISADLGLTGQADRRSA